MINEIDKSLEWILSNNLKIYDVLTYTGIVFSAYLTGTIGYGIWRDYDRKKENSKLEEKKVGE